MADPSQHQPTKADLREFSRKVSDSTTRFDARNASRIKSNEELRQQNEELLSSRQSVDLERQKYHDLFELAPDAYFVTDPRGVIREANAASSDLLGVATQFLIGKPLLVFFDPSARKDYPHQLDRLCGLDRVDDWETALTRRNGSPLSVSVSIGRILDRDKKLTGYRWIVRDVTRRKEAEANVRELNRELELRVASRTTQLAVANRVKDELLISERKAREEAEVANRVKSEFLALLSHEFRTPLQAVFGYTELLDREIHGALNETQRRYVQRIQQSQQHLLGLINTILEFAKLESGQPIDVLLAETPMNPILRVMESLIGPQIETKAIAYEYECPDKSIVAYADGTKVQQIVLNLLSNAVKFTGRGGNVKLDCLSDPDAIAVHVRDSGCGIPADKLEAIFQPFVQIKTKGTIANGTGLGLSISRRLAEAMGGSLTATSELGRGSTFTLLLRRAEIQVAV
jgi:PAS domain S-box-containing protein